MAEAAKRLCSVEQFLAFEGEADTRYQLVRGVVTAMAPAQAVHGRLVARLARSIGNQVQRPCEPVSAAGIKPGHRNDSYWVADLALTCSPLERGQIYLRDPVLLIEVLAPSTEATDRVFKLPDSPSSAFGSPSTSSTPTCCSTRARAAAPNRARARRTAQGRPAPPRAG